MERRQASFWLTVIPLSESTYYRLEDEAGPKPVVLLELQIWRDGFCVDYVEARRRVDEEKAREDALGVTACGIARLRALRASYQRN